MHQNLVQFEPTLKIEPFSQVLFHSLFGIFMGCVTLNIKCPYVTMAEKVHRSHLSAILQNILANVFVSVDTITLQKCFKLPKYPIRRVCLHKEVFQTSKFQSELHVTPLKRVTFPDSCLMKSTLCMFSWVLELSTNLRKVSQCLEKAPTRTLSLFKGPTS